MKIKTPLQIFAVCLGLAILLNPLARASGIKSTGAAAFGKMNALEARSAVPTPANLTRQLARPDAAPPWVQSMQRPAEFGVETTYAYDSLRACLKTRPVRAPGLQTAGFAAHSCRPRALTRRGSGVLRHALKRVVATVPKGGGTGQAGFEMPDVTTQRVFDSADNVVRILTQAGGLTATNVSQFDPAKRLVSTTGPTGTTNFTYSASGRVVMETYPGETFKITAKYLDGRLKSVTGSAVQPEYYDYAPQTLTTPVDQTTSEDNWWYRPFHLLGTGKSVGDPEDPRWNWQWKDRWERVFYEETPTVDHGTLLTEHFYDWGCPDRKTGVFTPGSGTTLLGYDLTGLFGNLTSARFDHKVRSRYSQSAYENPDGLVAPASTVRYTNSINDHVKLGDCWFQVSSNITCLKDNDAEKTVLSVQWTRLTGFPSGVVSEVRSWDASGASNVVTTTVDRASRQVVETHQSNVATNPVTRLTVNGLLITENTPSVSAPTVHIYDGFGRETRTVTPTGITLTNEYHAVTGLLLSRSDFAGNVTSYEYYPADHASAHRPKCESDPAGKKKYYAYDSRGNVTHTWGHVPYPERSVYDSYGDKVELHTFRGGTNWHGDTWPEGNTGTPDITRWTYHAATGLLLEKQDAAARTVQYQYDTNNLLQVRILSRLDGNGTSQIAITNLYNGYGEVIALQYSDGTAPVSFSDFNRQSLPRTITDASGTHTLAYDALGQRVSDVASGVGLSNIFSAYGLEARVVSLPGDTGFTQTYGYDPATGRLLTATQGDVSATYAYVTNHDVVASITFRNGSNTVLTTTKAYEFGSRLKTVTHSLAGAGTVDGRDYLFDALQRRTRATEADGAYWAYNYDDRSQLTAAKHYWPDNSPMPGQQFEFAYDPIGNRTVTATGGNQSGQNLRSATWQANELNQLVSRDIPGWLPVSGEAASNAFVTVNCETPFRRGEFFHRELSVNNASGPVWQAITNTAVFAGAGPEGADIVEERRGNRFVPPATELATYDADGNLTTDSRWTYSWDAENRLIGLETRTNVAASLGADFPRKKLAFTYDHQGRRTSKEVQVWNPSTLDYELFHRTRFVYDGWLLLAELDATTENEAPILTQSYLWGLDLSGTFAQAGGIGGLLVISNFQSQIASHLVCSDANGNVTALVNAGSGQPSARYDYAPFGELLRASGEAAALNPFRFSTKYADAETGLIYYGYRFYSPTMGKWINRDPLEEEGGRNLYGFILNDPVNLFDSLGLSNNSLADNDAAMTIGEGLMVGGAAVAGAIILAKAQNLSDALYQAQLFLGDCIDNLEQLSDKTFEALMYNGLLIADAVTATVVFSKQDGNQRHRDWADVSNEDVKTNARNPKLSSKERIEWQKEEKARDIKNKGKDRGGRQGGNRR